MSKIPYVVLYHKSWIYPTGSRYICDPPPTDTDQDFIVSIPPWTIRNVARELEDMGWKLDGSECADDKGRIKDKFMSYRKDDLNLILTCDKEFFDRFWAATTVAKKLNLMDKADRIALFQAVLYSNHYEEPEEEFSLEDYEQ